MCHGPQWPLWSVCPNGGSSLLLVYDPSGLRFPSPRSVVPRSVHVPGRTSQVFKPLGVSLSPVPFLGSGPTLSKDGSSW